MKILYISNYLDGSGYSQAAIANMLALDSVGVTVVPRPFRLNQTVNEIPARIRELEQNDSANCDVVIQHTLPIHMSANYSFRKNIAAFCTETDNCAAYKWVPRLNLMSEAWVNNECSAETLRNSGLKIPVKVFPIPIDPAKYKKEYSPLDIKPLNGQFVFYWIGELNRRKNLTAALKAFHIAFKPSDPVSLLIKTSYPGKSEKEVSDEVIAMAEAVKRELKIRPIEQYKKECIITQKLDEEQILRLHATGDVFISTSFAEGFCIPALDASMMGNAVICTDIKGVNRHVGNHYNGMRVSATLEPCWGMTVGTFPEMYTGIENWWSIDVLKLSSCMKMVYRDYEKLKNNTAGELDFLEKRYSYETIGEGMKESLYVGD